LLDCVQLVERIQEGDPAAEETLVRYFQPRIGAMLLARTRDRDVTLDLQQEALWESVRALRRGQLREPLKLPGFVLGIARNIVNNYFRTSQRGPRLTELPANLQAITDNSVQEREREHQVSRVLQKISATDRAILRSILIDGATPAQIAQRRGMTSEVVRQRKSRAIKQIQEMLRVASGKNG
jgi:RNA polymerase sigma factor (sigma-70 family)